MADRLPYSDSGEDTGGGPKRGATPGTPRWVKVFGVITLVLVLLVVTLMVASSGNHGPGRHLPPVAPVATHRP